MTILEIGIFFPTPFNIFFLLNVKKSCKALNTKHLMVAIAVLVPD
jgi:hypothetical protein